MSIFATLDVYHDMTPRSAAMNMAVDEALLEYAKTPSIRFYRWNHAALSFGYFGKFADVASYATQRDLVRRWTGGGVVFHGDDLTYSIVIPASAPVFSESSISIYEAVHRAIRDALAATGQCAELAAGESRKISETCFTNPARADVLVNGQKVAGAAQRRTRRSLLQQGSIQHVHLACGLADRFTTELSEMRNQKSLGDVLLRRAHEIAGQKYGTTSWLERR